MYLRSYIVTSLMAASILEAVLAKHWSAHTVWLAHDFHPTCNWLKQPAKPGRLPWNWASLMFWDASHSNLKVSIALYQRHVGFATFLREHTTRYLHQSDHSIMHVAISLVRESFKLFDSVLQLLDKDEVWIFWSECNEGSCGDSSFTWARSNFNTRRWIAPCPWSKNSSKHIWSWCGLTANHLRFSCEHMLFDDVLDISLSWIWLFKNNYAALL